MVVPLDCPTSFPDQLELLSTLRALGFQGFRTVTDLRTDALDAVPAEPGVYLVIRARASPPRFLAVGTGGHFKGKDPNVPVERLADEWVEGAVLVYVGQTGTKSNGTLKRRIRQMIRFGEGSPVGHRGGRLVWQLEDATELQFCWKEVRERVPRDVEKEVLAAFKSSHGERRPCANLTD